MKRTLLALSAVVSMSVVSLSATEEAGQSFEFRTVNNTGKVLNVDQEHLNWSLMNLLGGAPQLASYEIIAQTDESGKATHRNSVNISYQVPGVYVFKGANGTFRVEFGPKFKGSLMSLGIGLNLNYPGDLEKLSQKCMDSSFCRKHDITVTSEGSVQ